MTTQAIIQAILDHPMLMIAFGQNNFLIGWNSVFDGNNACAELAKRENASKLLLERLINADPKQASFSNMALEFLCSQYLKDPNDINVLFLKN